MSTKQSRWFTWSPNADTLVALLTEIAMIAAYWTAAHLLTRGWDGVLVFGVLTNLGLNVLFPVWWIANWASPRGAGSLACSSAPGLPPSPRSGCGKWRPV
jgi:hypothetical protein